MSLLHNQMSRLLETAFMYRATPAMPTSDAPSSPIKSNKRSPVRSPVKSPVKFPVKSPARQPVPKHISANNDVPGVSAFMPS